MWCLAASALLGGKDPLPPLPPIHQFLPNYHLWQEPEIQSARSSCDEDGRRWLPSTADRIRRGATTFHAIVSSSNTHCCKCTCANQKAPTYTNPFSCLLRPSPREHPRRFAATATPASSPTSRRRVASHDALPSGLPPGNPHPFPSWVSKTTSPPSVTQRPADP